MTTVKISQLPAILGADTATTDVLPIVDVSGNITNKITREEFFKNIASVDINGGTIDGTVIGGSSAAAGTFTTVTASGDVSIADKIVHTGDTNTAIRFPAADTVTIETSGTERVRVDSSGNVGIGTSSPATNLHVQGTETNVRIQGGSGTFSLGAANTGGRFYIFDNTASSERFTISSTGNVGIGTSSPATKADIFGGDARVGLASASTATFRGYQIASETTEFASLKAQASTGETRLTSGFGGFGGFTTFHTNGSERMRIDSSGNLGLGVTPSAWNSAFKALEIGRVGDALFSGSGGGPVLSANGYYASDQWRYGRTGAAANYELSLGQHRFYIAPSGTAGNAITFTQAMTLDASGNLGVGTTSPASKLDVNGTTRISNGDGLFVAGNISGGSPFVSGGAIEMGATSSLATIQAFNRPSFGAYDLLLATSTNMRFSVANAERARIDSSGNLLVGKTSTLNSDAGIRLYGGSDVGAADFTRSGGRTAQFNRLSSDGTVVEFARQSTPVGTISVTTSSTSYNTSSDYRLKENVAPMQNALDTVAQLNPVTYTWKADGSAGQGFIAHELQAVVPDCVTGEKDAVDADGNPQYQGVDTSFLVATLVKAIQELTARVAELENR